MQAGFFKRAILSGLLFLAGIGWLTGAHAQSEMTIARTRGFDGVRPGVVAGSTVEADRIGGDGGWRRGARRHH